jgi:cytochrome bd-type quinol oxidase subunit 2
MLLSISLDFHSYAPFHTFALVFLAAYFIAIILTLNTIIKYMRRALDVKIIFHSTFFVCVCVCVCMCKVSNRNMITIYLHRMVLLPTYSLAILFSLHINTYLVRWEKKKRNEMKRRKLCDAFHAVITCLMEWENE